MYRDKRRSTLRYLEAIKLQSAKKAIGLVETKDILWIRLDKSMATYSAFVRDMVHLYQQRLQH